MARIPAVGAGVGVAAVGLGVARVGRVAAGGLGPRFRAPARSIEVHFLPIDHLARDLGNKCTAQVHF